MAEKRLGWKASIIIGLIAGVLVQSMCRAVHLEQSIQPAEDVGVLSWWAANRPVVVGYFLWFWAFIAIKEYLTQVWRAWNDN